MAATLPVVPDVCLSNNNVDVTNGTFIRWKEITFVLSVNRSEKLIKGYLSIVYLLTQQVVFVQLQNECFI